MPEVMKQIAAKSDLPADVKTQAEAFNKELTAVSAKLLPPAGGRGGGGGRGADPTPIGKATAAKNGMMGGMWPTALTMTAYNEAKTEVPAAISEANTVLTKAQALSTALARHSITLTVAPAKPATQQ